LVTEILSRTNPENKQEMSGRRPKPTALKMLQGNPGKRALNANEPKPTGIPSCPRHLSAAAKQEWKRISRELIAIGLLTKIDRAALAAYCAAYARWIEAEDNVAKFGHVVKAPSGYPIQNPYLSIANTCLDQIRKFATEFGLTPASRSRLQISAAPATTNDEWSQLFGNQALDVPDGTNIQ
jgi:P27 family predicted phage terminase small subunit